MTIEGSRDEVEEGIRETIKLVDEMGDKLYMRPTYCKTDSKIIRDAVHGDILIDTKFLKVIDTPEFQRLRRIRQLSTAYLLFPTAEHTRFSHSIGTYHVMRLLIDHFIPIIEGAGAKVSQREINLALGAALLHDIGHGPFSHAFEGALPIKGQKYHEDWTIDIIQSEESQVNKVLRETFDESFPLDLAKLIKQEKYVKKYEKDINKDKIDLFFIMSSLISSQLDADRMDYLIRDAFFTGVTFGKYDMSRLINSLTLNVSDNKYLVCVNEKYMSTVEEYLISRYKMYEGVYLHKFKCEMDTIVKKILFRAFELYKDKQLNELPEVFKNIFEGKEMEVKEYITLDDSFLISLFNSWRNEKDEILKCLCEMFLNRKKYKILDILDNTDEDIESFEKDLEYILKKYDYKSNLKSSYFWISEKEKSSTYKDSKQNIWILNTDGTICDLFKKSKIITENLRSEINMCYISFDLLRKSKQISNVDEAIEEIENLIEKYNKKNHVEIEKKYRVQNKNSFEKTIEAILKLGTYDIDDSYERTLQEDTYFDTKDRLLFNSNKTLRIRKKEGIYALTIKEGTQRYSNDDINIEDQNERYEHEIVIENSDLASNSEYILRYLPELKDKIKQLDKTLIVNNKRKKVMLTKGEIAFEMAFDHVEYIGKRISKEYQIEIELKSQHLHRVNLKMLTDYLERSLEELEMVAESKYERGLTITESV